MKHLLLAKGLRGLVDRTEVVATGASSQQEAEHKRRQQKTLSTIVMAICPSQLYLITSYEQPKPAWDALCDHFKKDSLANKLLLKKQYFRMEMKNGTSVESHIKQMKELTDKLAALGAAIAEDQVVTLLGSLPAKYQTLVTALEARDTVSLSYVQQSLMHEEKKLNGEYGAPMSEKSSNSGDSALFHKECRERGSSRGQQQQWKPKCFRCGQTERNCPTKLKQEYSNNPTKHNTKPAEEIFTDTAEEDGVFAASLGSSTTSREEWLIDSGATSHMTHSREFLCHYQKFETPERVSLGDGHTVTALGSGEI